MRSLHSDFAAFIWLQLTPYDTHCCLSEWSCQGMTSILIAGTWCIFCVQCECSMGSTELLGSSGGLQAVLLLPHPPSSSQQLASCPFWVGVPIPTLCSHRVHVLPSSSSWSSAMSSATLAAVGFCSRPSLWCCLAREWRLTGELRACVGLEGALCVYLCWGHWLGLCDKNKGLLCLGIPQRGSVLCAVFCSVV